MYVPVHLVANILQLHTSIPYTTIKKKKQKKYGTYDTYTNFNYKILPTFDNLNVLSIAILGQNPSNAGANTKINRKIVYELFYVYIYEI